MIARKLVEKNVKEIRKPLASEEKIWYDTFLWKLLNPCSFQIEKEWFEYGKGQRPKGGTIAWTNMN